MKWTPALLARLLAPLFLVPLLGLGARAHSVYRAAHQARLALEFGAGAVAAGHLAVLAEAQPWRVDLWQLAGRYALQGGDPRSARKYLERADVAGHLGSSGRLALGDAFLEAGDESAAQAAWSAALEGSPDPGAIYERLLALHRAQGDHATVAQDLRFLVALRPTDPGLRYELGLVLAVQQPESALVHLTQAADLQPELAGLSADLVAAIRSAAIEDDPAYTLLQVGRVLGAHGEWLLAGEAFRQAVYARPDYAEAWAFLAEARQQAGTDGGSGQALSELTRALELDPGSLVANTLMALYWQRHADDERALIYQQAAAEAHPQNPAVQADLGAALAYAGRYEQALQAYQAAVELAPRQAAYYRLLASFCIRYEYLLEDVGLPAARRAVDLEPQAPESLDVMAQALTVQGDIAGARRFLERALQSDPAYPPARLHMGLLYALEGNLEAARLEWEGVQGSLPDTPEAAQAARLLENYFR